MKRVILGAAVALVLAGGAKASGADQYQNEIADTTKSLREVKNAIKEKRVEKEKCLLEEKVIRREMGKIDQELSRLQKQRERLRREIRKAEKSVEQAARELNVAAWEKRQWGKTLNGEMNEWYRSSLATPALFNDPALERAQLLAMVQSHGLINDAQRKELLSRQSMDRWKAAQKKLVGLKAEQEQNISDQEGLKGQKEQFLKTTIGRRVMAEEEIKKLQDSAKALEQLILKLEKEKKKSEEESRDRQKFQEKRRHLPWPVRGDVVLKFGKNRHPELDTYVISNGIKIKARSGVPVAAVDKGEVIFGGEFRSYGQMVIVDHGGGFYTIYGQLGEILVDEGQKVAGGDPVGRLGSNQPVLYFEVRSDQQPEDPMLWLD